MDSLAWCRSRLFGAENTLRITLPYAPKSRRNAILALHAIIAEIRAVPDEVSDPAVGERKLDWWAHALTANAEHPAILAMSDAGGWQWLEPEAFHPLITATRVLVGSPRFEQIEELWAYCRETGGTSVALEAGLYPDTRVPRETLLELGSASCLIEVVGNMARDARVNRWLVPLDLQARYQISRMQVASGVGGAGFDGMARHLLETALVRHEAACAAIPADAAWRLRHVLIRSALDAGLARKLMGRPSRQLYRRAQSGGAVNAWAAWRYARRLRSRSRVPAKKI